MVKSTLLTAVKLLKFFVSDFISRIGFLFLIIFPILTVFIYEIYAVIKEIKSPNEE